MSKFIPFYNKIEVKPFKKESVIVQADESLIEVGEVVAIGERVTFVKVGDIIYFDSWGCTKTDYNGEVHYVVPEDSNIILGKDESK